MRIDCDCGDKDCKKALIIYDNIIEVCDGGLKVIHYTSPTILVKIIKACKNALLQQAGLKESNVE